jgi:hypothetical protein
MKQSRTDVLIVAVVLAASFLSLVLFSHAWWRLTIDGRVFSGTAGRLAILLIRSLPFVWPYILAGILFRQRHGLPTGLWWTLGSGVAGGALHALLVRGSFPPGASLQSYFEFYCGHALAAVFAVVAFLIWPRSRACRVPTA